MSKNDVTWIPTLSCITMVYRGTGNVLIDIGPFSKCPPGIVLFEQTLDGDHWTPFHAMKLGRGMLTNCVDAGPAHFRGQVELGQYTALRVRCQDTLDMNPIDVRITYAGVSREFVLRAMPNYVIEEVPDLRDLIN